MGGLTTWTFFIFVLNFLTRAYCKDTSVIDMITKRGYPAEEHFVTTTDGYILRLHRIPYGKKSTLSKDKIFLLVHGLGSSSIDWVLLDPHNSLGFILADHGYDVWLANTRGNHQSRNHTTMNPDKDPRFWQFTWHECGTIDLPTMIDYILETTRKTALYNIGHSQGTNAFYVMASELPEYNKKVIAHFSFAPTPLLNHVRGSLKRIAVFPPAVDFYISRSTGELLPFTPLPFRLFNLLWRSYVLAQSMCIKLYFMHFGYSPDQLNTTFLSFFYSNSRAGGSLYQLKHYAPVINPGEFCQFDYECRNVFLKEYHAPTPPCYDLRRVKTPVYIFYSLNDHIVGAEDAELLCEKLGAACREKYLIHDPHFNHGDFLFGIDVVQFVHRKLLSLLSEIERTSAA